MLQAALSVCISEGFQDRKKRFMLSRSGSIDTGLEQRLSCTRRRWILELYCTRTTPCTGIGIGIVYVDANDIHIVLLFFYQYKLFLGYQSNLKKNEKLVSDFVNIQCLCNNVSGIHQTICFLLFLFFHLPSSYIFGL